MTLPHPFSPGQLSAICLLVLIGAAGLGPSFARAEGRALQDATNAIDPELTAAGWRLFSDSRWAPARFRLLPDGAIEVTSDNSTALIWKEVERGDARKTRLTWEWRVDRNTPPTDITVKGGDDRPLALHIWFMKPRDELNFFERLRADVLEAVVGLPVHGRLLTYVWGGRREAGDAGPNPHVGDGSRMFVLRSGRAELGVWLPESRDLIADYRAAFGEDPPERGIVALAADSEDTRTGSRARLRRLRFAH